ncbi:MAG: 16S rRNA (cytosine(1402)-N(4))-methyltransferase RsmH [Dehalococcoidia bacterium]|nr:MAG: 16S rRNA (cytosine(1402)-N(4))-methyltransferase RsmH [Dehalococcoidia bacterium]
MEEFVHIPVLLNEAIEALRVQPGGRYIDCTVGEGGHAVAILEKSSPGGQLLGIDADPQAIDMARKRLLPYGKSALLVNDDFKNLEGICSSLDFHPVHGILFDLGLSSFQLSNRGRGFSFQLDAPLDMRFSPSLELTAATIVNTFPERELATIIERYGEEHRSRQIARSIIASRPLSTTLELAAVVERAVGIRGRIHPATRTFQALRIAVNQELDRLEEALKQAVNLLGIGGRLVIISFHSLEDRLVKEYLREESQDCLCPPKTPVCVCGHTATLRLITRKVITPSLDEIQANPRSRSAKMRVAERIEKLSAS